MQHLLTSAVVAALLLGNAMFAVAQQSPPRTRGLSHQAASFSTIERAPGCVIDQGFGRLSSCDGGGP